MLPAAHRLTGAEQFRQAVRQGSRAGGPVVVVHACAPKGDDSTRVGLVVSKAVGNAVTRNLVKRRLRHALKDRLESLGSGRLVVVRANPAAAAVSFGELCDHLDRCLARALERSQPAVTA